MRKQDSGAQQGAAQRQREWTRRSKLQAQHRTTPLPQSAGGGWRGVTCFSPSYEGCEACTHGEEAIMIHYLQQMFVTLRPSTYLHVAQLLPHHYRL